MLNDLINSSILFVIIGITGFLTEFYSRKNAAIKSLFEKILLFVIAICASFSLYLIDLKNLLILFAVVILIFSFFVAKYNVFSITDEKNHTRWGIFYFSIANLLLIYSFPDSDKWIIFFSNSVFSFVILSAELTGRKINLSANSKSIAGSLIVFFTSLAVFSVAGKLLIFANFDQSYPIEFNLYFIFSIVIISFIITMIEILSSDGVDYLLIPVIASILLYIFIMQNNSSLLSNFYIGMLLAAIVSILSFRAKFLTASGAAATFLLAGFIFGFGGLKWSVPILTFFILSSLLSKVRKKVNSEVEKYFEKSGVRDHWQVFANGGLGGIFVIANILSPNELFYYFYLASLAAVCADTWATELGTMKQTKTYNILNFKPIEQGISGGISLAGTSGALLGAAVIAFSGVYWIDLHLAIYFPLIIFAGFFGSIFDSYLGATVQLQYKCSDCGKITERKTHCETNTIYHTGFKWINNDVVNLFAGAAGSLIIVIADGFLK